MGYFINNEYSLFFSLLWELLCSLFQRKKLSTHWVLSASKILSYIIDNALFVCGHYLAEPVWLRPKLLAKVLHITQLSPIQSNFIFNFSMITYQHLRAALQLQGTIFDSKRGQEKFLEIIFNFMTWPVGDAISTINYKIMKCELYFI